MALQCFKCGADVVFDAEHIGKNGKKIPLDPATKTPHDCPMRENPPRSGINLREEEKDDHGNESFTSLPVAGEKPAADKYVDHTLKGQQRFKAFSDSSADALTRHADQWIDENSEFMRVKLIGQLQLSADGKTFAIALYYEEVAK